MLHFVTKKYTVFGDFSSLLTSDIKNIINFFPLDQYTIQNYVQNMSTGFQQNNQGLSIANVNERFNIVVLINRIDIEITGKDVKYENFSHCFNSLSDLYGKKLTRLAISQIVAIPDKDDEIKNNIAGKIITNGQTLPISEFSMRWNSIVTNENEEINRIVMFDNGFIQNIKFANKMAVPVLEKALYVSTDINTSQKNTTERFSKSDLEKHFNVLENENDICLSEVTKIIE